MIDQKIIQTATTDLQGALDSRIQISDDFSVLENVFHVQLSRKYMIIF